MCLREASKPQLLHVDARTSRRNFPFPGSEISQSKGLFCPLAPKGAETQTVRCTEKGDKWALRQATHQGFTNRLEGKTKPGTFDDKRCADSPPLWPSTRFGCRKRDRQTQRRRISTCPMTPPQHLLCYHSIPTLCSAAVKLPMRCPLKEKCCHRHRGREAMLDGHCAQLDKVAVAAAPFPPPLAFSGRKETLCAFPLHLNRRLSVHAAEGAALLIWACPSSVPRNSFALQRRAVLREGRTARFQEAFQGSSATQVTLLRERK